MFKFLEIHLPARGRLVLAADLGVIPRNLRSAWGWIFLREHMQASAANSPEGTCCTFYVYRRIH